MIYLEAQRNRIMILTVLMLISMMFVSLDVSKAGEKVTIITDPPNDLQISNEENQYIKYGYDEYKPIGNMKLYKNDYEVNFTEDDTGMWLIETDDSKRFVFEPTAQKCFDDFYVHLKGGLHQDKKLRGVWFEKAVISEDGVQLIAEKGSSCEYYIGMYVNENNTYYNIEGISIKDISLTKDRSRVFLKGAQGNIKITLCKGKSNQKVVADGRFFTFGNTIKINRSGKRIKVSLAVRIPTKEVSHVNRVYLRPCNEGKNMFLTWNRVKKAKSYVVYKYDKVTKKYKKVAIRNGKSINYYNIPGVKNGEVYKYKVVAKIKKDGKGKSIGKTSYPVWAVAKENAKGNATKVATNKRSITKKAGKKEKVKASVMSAGKPLLSQNIRWYSSNRKVATIGKKTGIINFKKKGTCYIWAKAHNGKNSKIIKVKVK